MASSTSSGACSFSARHSAIAPVTRSRRPGSPTVRAARRAACDRSLERAREFFARCYPEERYAIATCHSWLLDPQLQERLPPASNILRFQRRFQIAYVSPEEFDQGTLGFVFGDPDQPLDALPRRNSLERAIVDHLRAGEHWHVGHGWFEL